MPRGIKGSSVKKRVEPKKTKYIHPYKIGMTLFYVHTMETVCLKWIIDKDSKGRSIEPIYQFKFVYSDRPDYGTRAEDIRSSLLHHSAIDITQQIKEKGFDIEVLKNMQIEKHRLFLESITKQK